MNNLVAIISGGQTGVDQGALEGAKSVGLDTGGWMPRNFMTEAGPAPHVAEHYELREHSSPSYPVRTRLNVKESDGTVWLPPLDVERDDSRGFQCTRNAADKYERPFAVVKTAEELRTFVARWGIRTLNVAGPRASRDPSAHDRAHALIVKAFGDPSLTGAAK